ncbi:MAG: hypothetical protein JWN17_2761, partial [Frankiales bacterium]|nr:hypothetical protein [Frankiales bacterium]
LRRLLEVPRATAPGPGLAEALQLLGSRPRRRGLTVVVSDLLAPQASWERPLRLLAARSEVVVVQVVDPRELALPAAGVLALVDPATGAHLTVRTTTAVRDRYAAAAADRAQAQRAAVRSAGADLVVLSTGSDWLPVLARALAVRRRTRAVRRTS